MAKAKRTPREESILMARKAMRSAAFAARPSGRPRRSHFHDRTGTRSSVESEAIRDSSSHGAW